MRLYQAVIDAERLDFRLYMAITSAIYEMRFQSPLTQLMIQRSAVHLLVFDPKPEVVEQWID